MDKIAGRAAYGRVNHRGHMSCFSQHVAYFDFIFMLQ